jgi:HPt (histidine-containing phosphotransfer) domain-containing protein
VKEQLVQGINPLSEVELTVTEPAGQEVTRYLSFHFNRVQDGAAVRHLLVTVQDISRGKSSCSRSWPASGSARKRNSMMLKAFETEPAMMRAFVERAEASLLEVNDLLRSTSSASSEAQVLKRIDGAYRRIHAFKGDAASLGLEILATLAHQFESELQKLKDNGAATGDALLALPLPLEDLLSKVGAFKSLSQKRSGDKRTAARRFAAWPQRRARAAGGRSGHRLWQAGEHRSAHGQCAGDTAGQDGPGARDRHPAAAQCRGARHRGARNAASRAARRPRARSP